MRKFKLIVQNIVSNAHLGAPINCELVAEELQARLNHKVFPALVSVCKETRTTNCCFGSGQIVVSGRCVVFFAVKKKDLLQLP